MTADRLAGLLSSFAFDVLYIFTKCQQYSNNRKCDPVNDHRSGSAARDYGGLFPFDLLQNRMTVMRKWEKNQSCCYSAHCSFFFFFLFWVPAEDRVFCRNGAEKDLRMSNEARGLLNCTMLELSFGFLFCWTRHTWTFQTFRDWMESDGVGGNWITVVSNVNNTNLWLMMMSLILETENWRDEIVNSWWSWLVFPKECPVNQKRTSSTLGPLWITAPAIGQTRGSREFGEGSFSKYSMKCWLVKNLRCIIKSFSFRMTLNSSTEFKVELAAD